MMEPFRQRIVALIVQYTKFILTFVYITEFFWTFPPQTFTGQSTCLSFKLFKRYIDCFLSICKRWRNRCKTYCGVGNGLRVVPIFPQGQQSGRNASARENHPTQFSTLMLTGLGMRALSLSSTCAEELWVEIGERLFQRVVIFTRARVSLALLSLRKNGDYSQSRQGSDGVGVGSDGHAWN